MAENCTVYCKAANIEEVKQLLCAYFPGSSLNSAETMVVQGDNGALRCSARIFRERGDDFCRLLLGTRAFVDQMEFTNCNDKKSVLDHIVSTKMALGIVADPAFDADERYHAVVFAIAKKLDAVVFNGHEVLDASGKSIAATT